MANFWFALDVGAYDKKTAHLTLLQHGVYFALMRHYYSTQKPIPLDAGQLQRVCRANSGEELEALAFILKSFFTLKSDGYHNRRADEEIVKAKQLSKLRANSAKRRWDDNRKAKAHAIACAQAQPIADTVTVTVTTTEPKSKAITAKAQFTPPSVEEVSTYCRERGNGIDAEHFVSHYAARGWKYSGGVKMSDWKKAIITWEKRNGRTNPNQRPAQQTRQPSAQVERFHNNRAELARAFGAAAVGGVSGANRSGQEARLSAGDTPALEGEVRKLPR